LCHYFYSHSLRGFLPLSGFGASADAAYNGSIGDYLVYKTRHLLMNCRNTHHLRFLHFMVVQNSKLFAANIHASSHFNLSSRCQDPTSTNRFKSLDKYTILSPIKTSPLCSSYSRFLWFRTIPYDSFSVQVEDFTDICKQAMDSNQYLVSIYKVLQLLSVHHMIASPLSPPEYPELCSTSFLENVVVPLFGSVDKNVSANQMRDY
jgi:hypothetical protein